MKKILACLLIIILCLSCLASCENSYVANQFFSDELLSENGLSDMTLDEINAEIAASRRERRVRSSRFMMASISGRLGLTK